MHDVVAVLHQDLAQVGIGPVLGDPRHVVEELLFGVGAEVARQLLRREIGRERLDVVRAVVDDPHQAFGE
ncbi:hypothetical protein D3C83_268080 [compost metagenome]